MSSSESVSQACFPFLFFFSSGESCFGSFFDFFLLWTFLSFWLFLYFRCFFSFSSFLSLFHLISDLWENSFATWCWIGGITNFFGSSFYLLRFSLFIGLVNFILNSLFKFVQFLQEVC